MLVKSIIGKMRASGSTTRLSLSNVGFVNQAVLNTAFNGYASKQMFAYPQFVQTTVRGFHQLPTVGQVNPVDMDLFTKKLNLIKLEQPSQQEISDRFSKETFEDNLTKIGGEIQPSDDGACAEIMINWVDIEDLEEGDSKDSRNKSIQCLNTMERRNLKMKKHRRQKRKKKMFLKLKASGKL